eukprot:1397528-Rhodomonas_salina.1
MRCGAGQSAWTRYAPTRTAYAPPMRSPLLTPRTTIPAGLQRRLLPRPGTASYRPTRPLRRVRY